MKDVCAQQEPHVADTKGHPMAGGPPDNDVVSLYEDALEAGALVGDWVIESRVHAGVTAWLYRASHLSTRAPAALKVVRTEFNHVTSVLRRFQQEADTLRALRHPHIVEVLDQGGLRDGRPWLAMEWLEGESVDQWLARRGPFSLEEALTVMQELGAALHFAHGHGILHRDLKAQNVMVLPRGDGFTVKLVDFGIARVEPPEGLTGLTTGGAVLGTPVSMAPEQIRGQAVDARTDLYALGVLLYQLLTGALPFQGSSAVEVEEQHLHAPPPHLGERMQAPPALDAVVQRCLAKAPEDRWPDVPSFLNALRATWVPVPEGAWAAAVYVDLRFPDSLDEPSDAALDARDAAMDAALTELKSQGWALAMGGGNAVLAWRRLPPPPRPGGPLGGRAPPGGFAAAARVRGRRRHGRGGPRLRPRGPVRVGAGRPGPAEVVGRPAAAPGVLGHGRRSGRGPPHGRIRTPLTTSAAGAGAAADTGTRGPCQRRWRPGTPCPHAA
ncbi:serine/threonine-protein kinase [Myxococcus sp. MxC21-1]|uniref:serine/threonine-protein kinase n=1 Tax=Myxococcus sp. MxC21-1 TaxID=3041439 RepID=UPI00292E9837|nr:serine/threonine-protein kinase [Myxococcus sp. MxC21-1]WNZ59035.1 serine/threonine-protein kinase [Myxococcus sp. MxC21-1]